MMNDNRIHLTASKMKTDQVKRHLHEAEKDWTHMGETFI